VHPPRLHIPEIIYREQNRSPEMDFPGGLMLKPYG
jgi:hypothetical protein